MDEKEIKDKVRIEEAERQNIDNEKKTSKGLKPSYCEKCEKETGTKSAYGIQTYLIGFIGWLASYFLIFNHFEFLGSAQGIFAFVVGLWCAKFSANKFRRVACAECKSYKPNQNTSSA